MKPHRHILDVSVGSGSVVRLTFCVPGGCFEVSVPPEVLVGATSVGPFQADLQTLLSRSVGCPGEKHLTQLDPLAKEIDKQAAQDNVVFADYQKAVQAGNDWLVAMGFSTTRFSAG